MKNKWSGNDKDAIQLAGLSIKLVAAKHIVFSCRYYLRRNCPHFSIAKKYSYDTFRSDPMNIRLKTNSNKYEEWLGLCFERE